MYSKYPDNNLGQTELPFDIQNYKSDHDHKLQYKLINFQSEVFPFNPIQAAEWRYTECNILFS